MPIYEYTCQKCGYSFDELVKRKTKKNIFCPKCGSKKIKKKISTFSGFGCASCPAREKCRK